MGGLSEFPFNQSQNSHNQLLDEFLSYLPTRFSSHIFDHIVYDDSDDDPYYSESNVPAFYPNDSIYFSWNFKNDVCAIPISTYQYAAQALKQYKSVGHAHTTGRLSGTLFELQEATPSRQVTKTSTELTVRPHPEQPQKLSPLTRHS